MQELKQFWNMAVDKIEEEVSQGLYHMLRKDFEIALIEDKKVVIRTESEFNADFARRKAARALNSVFSDMLDRPVMVKFTVQKLSPVTEPRQTALTKAYESNTTDELAVLHERYGDIMGIVDNHPLFCKATTPVEKGGWGIFPQLLTIACKEYDVMTVLETLRFTANRPSVRNPRAFFFKVLENEQFGKKLAATVAST